MSGAGHTAGPWRRVEQIGRCTLILGDCLQILPHLPGYDAILSDPPYGRGYKKGKGGGRGRMGPSKGTKMIEGDDKPFDPSPFFHCPAILWGANHYSARLPHGRWLAWNKLGDKEPWDSYCDVEFAWQNTKAPDRIFSLLWKGVCRGSLEDGIKRMHPNQKPTALMRWCLQFLPDARTVLDPYMGSASTGVACVRECRDFIGIEIDESYFETACQRIRDADERTGVIYA
jgi:site-specific DNA-methyltransferase (adenine-specific)